MFQNLSQICPQIHNVYLIAPLPPGIRRPRNLSPSTNLRLKISLAFWTNMVSRLLKDCASTPKAQEAMLSMLKGQFNRTSWGFNIHILFNKLIDYQSQLLNYIKDRTEVWKLFSLSSTDAPALLPFAMLPRQQARKTHKNNLQNLLYSFFLSLSAGHFVSF